LARVFTIPALPDPARRKSARQQDPRYVEGQRLLVDAMNYLLKADRRKNKEAVTFLSEHFRTQFRMSDRPAEQP
jgi:hypothetical protein